VNEAVFFLSLITILLTLIRLYGERRATWGLVAVDVLLCVLWFATAEVTVTAYPSIGVAPALIYDGFSVVFAALSFRDGFKVFEEDVPWG